MIKFQFQTNEEIKEYFSGETVQCLICGKYYKSLTPHIKSKHNISAREYKNEYGLPLNRGLNSESFHNNMSSVKKEEFILGIGSSGSFSRDRNLLKKALSRCIKSRESKQPFFKNMMIEKNRKSDCSIVEIIRKRMEDQNRTLQDICNNDNDVPSLVTYYKRLKELRSNGIVLNKIDTHGRKQSAEHIKNKRLSRMNHSGFQRTLKRGKNERHRA